MVTSKSAASDTTSLHVPYYVRGLALGLSAYLIGVHLWSWVFTGSIFLTGQADFRSFYTAGLMVRSGYASQLYDYPAELKFQNMAVSQADIALPFIHPAAEALLFVPLSLLSYRAAYLVFLALNALALSLSYWLLRPSMKKLAAIYAWLPAAMFLAFLPVAAALLNGQDSLLLLTLLAAAFAYLRRDRDLTAGMLVGLCLFKFQIALPIAALFLVWRYWRFCIGFAVSGVVVGLGSVSLVGITQSVAYVRSLIHMSTSTSDIHQLIYGIYPVAMPNIYGLLFGMFQRSVPHTWIHISAVVASGVLFCYVAAMSQKKRGTDALLVAIPASTLISYHLLIHDLSILLIPIVIMLDRFIEFEGSSFWQARVIVLASALVFVAPLYRSFVPGQFYLVSVPVLFFALATAAASGIEQDPQLQQRVAI